MKPKITARSRRSLAEACERAGVAFPRTVGEIGETYLLLLVSGVDHAGVGRLAWADSIFRDAPLDPVPDERRS